MVKVSLGQGMRKHFVKVLLLMGVIVLMSNIIGIFSLLTPMQYSEEIVNKPSVVKTITMNKYVVASGDVVLQGDVVVRGGLKVHNNFLQTNDLEVSSKLEIGGHILTPHNLYHVLEKTKWLSVTAELTSNLSVSVTGHTCSTN